MQKTKISYDRSSRLRMNAYDRLPPSTRAALQNADHDINPIRLLEEMRDAGATDEQLVRMIERVRVL